MSAIAAAAGVIWQAIRPILLLFGFTALIGATSNLVGSVTGQNPMAQFTTTMMQNMMPLLITMMPLVIVMNLMMSMVNMMFAPITRMMAPPVTYYW